MINRRRFIKNSTIAAAAAVVTGGLQARSKEEKKLIDDPHFILPPRLKSGDTIALTAPAGAIFNEDSIEKATKSFEAQGFRVKHGGTLSQKFGYLAGTDAFRAAELNDLFADKDVNAIVAMRGGWGCARILNLLDFDKILANPKILSGFSDITTLLHAIYVKTGLITFHGPVGNSTLEGFTMDNFLRIVKDGEALNMIQPAGDPVTTISEGRATGKLFGGNLSVICSMIGTGYLPDFTNSIFFLEETEEEPYQVDRYLTQLELAGTIGRISAIVFGKCTKCDAEEPDKSFFVEDVLLEKFRNLYIPAVSNFAFGHVKDKFTFPVGGMATFDTANSSIQLTHPCVS
jgi:muramoyltetrapeptide carboxypeptidase